VSRFLFCVVALFTSCTSVSANPNSAQNEALRSFKSSIIEAVHQQVREIDFRERGDGFSFCRVSFKVHKDGTITDLHTDDRAHGEFAAQVRSKVEALSGSSHCLFPQNVHESSVKIEFSLTQDDKLPITSHANIAADPNSTSTVALTWEDWHKRIVERLYSQIYQQIEPLLTDYQHLRCVVTYKIRKAAQIEVLKIEGSEDMTFRGIVSRTIESLHNQPIIIFPECAGNATSITKRSEFDFRLRR